MEVLLEDEDLGVAQGKLEKESLETLVMVCFTDNKAK